MLLSNNLNFIKMKKQIQLKKGLNIKKESISKLQETQMVFLKGGCGKADSSCLFGTCNK